MDYEGQNKDLFIIIQHRSFIVKFNYCQCLLVFVNYSRFLKRVRSSIIISGVTFKISKHVRRANQSCNLCDYKKRNYHAEL